VVTASTDPKLAKDESTNMLRSIVLPAYNESGYIEEMIARTIRAGEQRSDPFEVIVVDNASTDDTAAIVEKLAAQDARIRLIRHPENRLYAASCMSGTKAAKGERVFILDSDGQHPPSDIWKFDEAIDQGFDVVFGWRVKRAEPMTRILISKFLLGLTRYYVAFDQHDVNCGIRGFNRRFAEALEIKHRVNFVNPELFVRAKLGGYRIGEVQVVQEERRAGVSSHEFGRLFRIFETVRGTLKRLSEELTAAQRSPRS
jgi:glycosyltransferase involved in cell wall biosynthesis